MAKPRRGRAGWVFEIKYDGFRTLALHIGGTVRLVSRKGTDMTASFPEVAAALRELPEVVLDGELIMLDAAGRPRFDRLRRRLAIRKPAAIE